MGPEHMVRFSLGGVIFEYDEEKTAEILRSMAFLSKLPPVFSLTMTVSKCLTMNIV